MADEAATALPGQVDDGELQHLKSYSDVGQHLRQKTQDGTTLPTVASADGHFGADKGSLEEVVESGFANGSSLKNWALTNAGWNFSASQNAWRPRHTVYGPSSRSSYTQSSVRYDAAASASRELNAR